MHWAAHLVELLFRSLVVDCQAGDELGLGAIPRGKLAQSLESV